MSTNEPTLDFAQDLSQLILESVKKGLPTQVIAQILIRTGQLIETNSFSDQPTIDGTEFVNQPTIDGTEFVNQPTINFADYEQDLDEYDPRLGVAELPFTPEELAKNTPNHDPSDLII